MSDRTISSEAAEALDAGLDHRAYLVRIDAPSGVALMTSHVRNIRYNGEDYLAVGDLGSISNVTETNVIQSHGLKLVLSGLNADLKDQAMEDFYQGSEVKVFCQFLDHNDDPFGDPILFWEGYLDTQDIVTGGGMLAIEAACENWMREWDQPRRLTYSDEDQQELHPGDRFFEHVPQLQNFQVKWGGGLVGGTGINPGKGAGGGGKTDRGQRPVLP